MSQIPAKSTPKSTPESSVNLHGFPPFMLYQMLEIRVRHVNSKACCFPYMPDVPILNRQSIINHFPRNLRSHRSVVDHGFIGVACEHAAAD